jgi:hypothetical protein
MAGRITKYLEPVPFHKTMGTHKLVIMKRIDDDDAGRVVNTNNGTTSMTDFEKIIRDHESLVLDFAKRQVDGEQTGLEKHDYLAAIENRAAKLRADGESKEQSFTKTIIEDEIGKLLFKALKRAPGSEVVVKAAAPDPSEDYVSPGPAHDELNERVVAHMKGNPALSYQQAFTREYTHPDNRSLKERVDAEGILRAQAREPAKPFPAYARG